MATVDRRRPDERNVTLATPYWIISDEITFADDDDNLLLFSFPSTKYFGVVYFHEVGLWVSTAFTAGATIIVGDGTLATDAVTTGGTFTNVDEDEYIESGTPNITTGGFYNSSGSNWLTAKAAGTGTPLYKTPAATTVPMVHATLASASDITAGALRVCMLISCIPYI